MSNALYEEIDRLKAKNEQLKQLVGHVVDLKVERDKLKADFEEMNTQRQEIILENMDLKAERDALKARLSVLVDRIAAKELSRERIFRAMRDNLYFAGRADEALFVHGPLLRALCKKGGGE